MHHRRFHFNVAPVVEELPHLPDDSRSCLKHFPRLFRRHQVQITLPVTQLYVRQPVPLLRQRQQRFAQEEKLLHPHRQLPGLGAEHVPAHARRGLPNPAGGIAETPSPQPHLSLHKSGYAPPTLANVQIPPCPSAGKTRCARQPASPSGPLPIRAPFARNISSPVPQACPSSGILAETPHSQALGFLRVSFGFAETGLEAQIARGGRSFPNFLLCVLRSIKAHSRPEQGSGPFPSQASSVSGILASRKQNPSFFY